MNPTHDLTRPHSEFQQLCVYPVSCVTTLTHDTHATTGATALGTVTARSCYVMGVM